MPDTDISQLAVDALEELKATDITVLDVREQTDITDAMIIATGRSSRHVSAVAENVVTRAKAAGHPPLGVEGMNQGEWVLIDLCDAIVHVMQPETREFYQLEKLWNGQEALAAKRARLRRTGKSAG